jgi:hypothetical protein
MVNTTACPPQLGNPQRLLTTPPLLDPDGIRALRQNIPTSEEDNEYGFCLINLRRLAVLESMLFPTVPSRLQQAEGSALCNEIVIREIANFLERVEQTWFPILTDEAWSTCIEPEVAWGLWNVPLMPQGVEYEHPDEICADGIFGGAGIVDLLMCLAAMEGWEFSDPASQQRISEQMHATYEGLPKTPADFLLSEVVTLLEQYPPPAPFDDLVAVCRLVLYETGNVWLDISYSAYYENHADEYWDNLDGLCFLRHAWQAAQPIVQARDRLEAWADAPLLNDGSRYRQIMQLLINRWEIRNGQMILPLAF